MVYISRSCQDIVIDQEFCHGQSNLGGLDFTSIYSSSKHHRTSVELLSACFQPDEC